MRRGGLHGDRALQLTITLPSFLASLVPEFGQKCLFRAPLPLSEGAGYACFQGHSPPSSRLVLLAVFQMLLV